MYGHTLFFYYGNIYKLLSYIHTSKFAFQSHYNNVLFVAASAMSQYAAAVPGYSWSLPPAATAAAAAAAAGTIPMSPYQAAQPQLQEARMQ